MTPPRNHAFLRTPLKGAQSLYFYETKHGDLGLRVSWNDEYSTIMVVVPRRIVPVLIDRLAERFTDA